MTVEELGRELLSRKLILRMREVTPGKLHMSIEGNKVPGRVTVFKIDCEPDEIEHGFAQLFGVWDLPE